MKQLLLFLMMLLPLTASADAVEIDGLYYNLVSKTKTAKVARNPNNYQGDISIPNNVTYEGTTYQVNTIGENAFYYCVQLTSVQIPSSINTIEAYAFDGCHLTSIAIPSSVNLIKSDAFANCSHLESVYIENLSSWLNIDFEGNFGRTNPLYYAKHLFLNGNEIKNLVIPNGVSAIKQYAFCNCEGIETISFSEGVETIGQLAFSGCAGLKSITFSNTITQIENEAFAHCAKLKHVDFPSSVTSIGVRCFQQCEKLETIVIRNDYSTKIDYNAFSNCAELTDVICYNTITPGTDGIFPPATVVFESSMVESATLHVPAGSIDCYTSPAPWKDFGNIVEITYDDVEIGDLGIGTFCGTNPMDFYGIDDIKAYTVSSYESASGQVTLSRVHYVPANTGIVVRGNKGTYSLPFGVGESITSNLLKGVTTNTVLDKVNGDYTNYVLANKGSNLGFYAVTDGSTLGAGKAYLPLPTADLPSAAREFVLVFDDGETTKIKSIASQEEAPKGCYDLQGRRVANPTTGLYIVNGKKVIIK